MLWNAIDNLKYKVTMFFVRHANDIKDFAKAVLVGFAGGVVAGCVYRAGFSAGENNMLRNMVRKNTTLHF